MQLSELQKNGIIKVMWISGDNNEIDMQTKNQVGSLFEKHTEVYYGDDKY